MKKLIVFLLSASLLFGLCVIPAIAVNEIVAETTEVHEQPAHTHLDDSSEEGYWTIRFDESFLFTPEEKAAIETQVADAIANGFKSQYVYNEQKDEIIAAFDGELQRVNDISPLDVEVHIQGAYAGIELDRCFNCTLLTGNIWQGTVVTYRAYHCALQGHSDYIYVVINSSTRPHPH